MGLRGPRFLPLSERVLRFLTGLDDDDALALGLGFETATRLPPSEEEELDDGARTALRLTSFLPEREAVLPPVGAWTGVLATTGDDAVRSSGRGFFLLEEEGLAVGRAAEDDEGKEAVAAVEGEEPSCVGVESAQVERRDLKARRLWKGERDRERGEGETARTTQVGETGCRPTRGVTWQVRGENTTRLGTEAEGGGGGERRTRAGEEREGPSQPTSSDVFDSRLRLCVLLLAALDAIDELLSVVASPTDLSSSSSSSSSESRRVWKRRLTVGAARRGSDKCQPPSHGHVQ